MGGRETGLPRAGGARNDKGGGQGRLQAGKHREMQVARTGGRKLFDEARRLAGNPKTGAAPRVATNQEVREALAKRLRAFRAQVRV